MLAVRSLAFNLCFYAATTLIAFGGLPTLVSGRAVMRLARFWGRVTLWLLNDTSQWSWAREVGADNVMTGFPAKYTQWRSTR